MVAGSALYSSSQSTCCRSRLTPPKAIVTVLAENAVHGKVTKEIGSIWTSEWMEKRSDVIEETLKFVHRTVVMLVLSINYVIVYILCVYC